MSAHRDGAFVGSCAPPILGQLFPNGKSEWLGKDQSVLNALLRAVIDIQTMNHSHWNYSVPVFWQMFYL